MTTLLPFLLFCSMLLGMVGMIYLAFAGPNVAKAQGRRLDAVRGRHNTSIAVTMETQMRRILANRDTKLDAYFMQFIPKPDVLRKRIAMTGKSWTLGQVSLVSVVITGVVAAGLAFKGLPLLLALLIGILAGLGIPHMALNTMIKRRIAKFTLNFPDAIELLVRGLRSGLPISETMQVVASEVRGPVGVEFRSVSDKMKIGKTMDAALQDVADRLGTPEFQFFVITLAIQRETGGNLAETLSNLAEVLRKRMQMKLKIKAMSSESKASAYIIGALPFIVFGMILFVNPPYMQQFFTDQRLIIAGGGGLIWMGIGAFIMRQMINFEI
jgi:tight adherence protein B